jgi:hypothetical protein
MDFRVDELKQSLESAVEGMSSAQLSWHPPGKWRAAEVLEHLYLTYTGTIKGFERVMRSGKPLPSRASMTPFLKTLADQNYLMNRDIAQKLGLSEHTISNYLFRIYEKLGISSRVELVLYMVRNQRLQG